MNFKNYILSPIMISIGLILHTITPPIFLGMKPDLLLIFLVMAILLNNDIKNVIISAVISAILSAITTSFPGGQIPNFIDKLITSFFILFLIKILKNIKNKNLSVSILLFLSTLISGAVFLNSANILVGLPAGILVLLTTVVLPTAVINMAIGVSVYKSITTAKNLSFSKK